MYFYSFALVLIFFRDIWNMVLILSELIRIHGLMFKFSSIKIRTLFHVDIISHVSQGSVFLGGSQNVAANLASFDQNILHFVCFAGGQNPGSQWEGSLCIFMKGSLLTFIIHYYSVEAGPKLCFLYVGYPP